MHLFTLSYFYIITLPFLHSIVDSDEQTTTKLDGCNSINLSYQKEEFNALKKHSTYCIIGE